MVVSLMMMMMMIAEIVVLPPVFFREIDCGGVRVRLRCQRCNGEAELYICLTETKKYIALTLAHAQTILYTSN